MEVMEVLSSKLGAPSVPNLVNGWRVGGDLEKNEALRWMKFRWVEEGLYAGVVLGKGGIEMGAM